MRQIDYLFFTDMEDHILKVPPFECDNVPMLELRQKWLDYKKQFEYIAEAMSKKKKKKLKSIFLAVAGRQLQRVYESLPVNDENDLENEEDFSQVIRRLDDYFAPKRHDTFERHSFWNEKPAIGETLDKFLLRAKVLADKCHFGTTERESKDAAIIDKMVMLAPLELRRKILERPTINLDELTKLINTHLSIQHQIRELGQQASFTSNVLGVNRDQMCVNKIFSDSSSHRSQIRSTGECGRCGYKAHKLEEHCPARNVKCRICNYIGHYAKKCKTNYKNNLEVSDSRKRKIGIPAVYQNQHRPKMSRISAISNENQELSVNVIGDNNQKSSEVNPEQSEGPDVDSFIYTISDNHDEMIWCRVGHVLIEMMIDSGSKHNIIDELTWNYMQNKNAIIRNVRLSNKRLLAYAQRSSLEIMCTFDADIEVVEGSHKNSTSFYVIRGGEQNLLGRDTAKQLGVLMIGLPSAINSALVQNISENAIEKFPVIKGS